ncbi:hypothetical protein [Catenulispora subtropica]|uniref:Uncharacterized protein n=1 Tax=Catenulispora subtropica TaxID=450798 RepID=A0ABN2R4M8_9ACTN
MIDGSEAELVIGVGSAVRGVAGLGSAALTSRGKLRQERARTERTVAVIRALPPGGEWTETSPDGWTWSVRMPQASE